LSESLDSIVRDKCNVDISPVESMLQAYKFVAAYSGVLNDVAVDAKYGETNTKHLMQ